MIMARTERNSDKTKKSILQAAEELFSLKGYDTVTMREIAKAAGCSHTTIYLYFKDKAGLLHHLSKAPLEKLYKEMKQIAESEELPMNKLKKIGSSYILFGLSHPNMYSIFIQAQSSRVDEVETELEINKLRLALFAVLEKVIGENLWIEKGKETLACSRIFFYTLHGIVATYQDSEETIDDLLERLGSTFDFATESLVSGFHSKLNTGGHDNEGKSK